MFMKIINKILPKKENKKVLTGRDLAGRNNVGYPTVQLSNEIDTIVHKYYRDIKTVIKVYKDTVFFRNLPSVIDLNLSDSQLESLSGRNVQMVYLLLFRDMLRHVAKGITPRTAPENWADLLAQEVLDATKMLKDNDDPDVAKKQQLFDSLTISDLDDDVGDVWFADAAALIQMSAMPVYQVHHKLVAKMMKKLSKKKK